MLSAIGAFALGAPLSKAAARHAKCDHQIPAHGPTAVRILPSPPPTQIGPTEIVRCGARTIASF